LLPDFFLPLTFFSTYWSLPLVLVLNAVFFWGDIPPIDLWANFYPPTLMIDTDIPSPSPFYVFYCLTVPTLNRYLHLPVSARRSRGTAANSFLSARLPKKVYLSLVFFFSNRFFPLSGLLEGPFASPTPVDVVSSFCQCCNFPPFPEARTPPRLSSFSIFAEELLVFLALLFPCQRFHSLLPPFPRLPTDSQSIHINGLTYL